MNSSTPPPTSPLPLESLSFAETRDWLERALRGREPLPSAVRGELPQTTILRHTPSLTLPAENRLRVACENLVQAFASAAESDTEYVQSLLSLAVGLRAGIVTSHLKSLCENAGRADALSMEQWQAVVSALVDLKARLPDDFWLSLARHLPGATRVLVVSALLLANPDAAAQAIPLLPNEDAVADALFVVLRQHAQVLGKEELSRLARAIMAEQSACPSAIAKALADWTGTLPVGTLHAPQVSFDFDVLSFALKSFCLTRRMSFTPQPMSARLVA